MIDPKFRDTLTANELVSYHLRHMTLLLDPLNGHMTRLAESLEVHPRTLRVWIENGHVPPHQYRKMLKRFGKKHVIMSDLCRK